MTTLTKLERIAGEVALTAPTKRSGATYGAVIPWDIVEALRAELERRGVDWRKAQQDLREATR